VKSTRAALGALAVAATFAGVYAIQSKEPLEAQVPADAVAALVVDVSVLRQSPFRPLLDTWTAETHAIACAPELLRLADAAAIAVLAGEPQVATLIEGRFEAQDLKACTEGRPNTGIAHSVQRRGIFGSALLVGYEPAIQAWTQQPAATLQKSEDSTRGRLQGMRKQNQEPPAVLASVHIAPFRAKPEAAKLLLSKLDPEARAAIILAAEHLEYVTLGFWPGAQGDSSLRAELSCNSAASRETLERGLIAWRKEIRASLPARLAGVGGLLDTLDIQGSGSHLEMSAHMPADALVQATRKLLARLGPAKP
jgi:hypothetical protein